MKRITILIIISLLSISCIAFDFVVDGIYYSKLSNTNNEVEVTYYGSWGNTYSGNITIPETVIHKNETYYVTTIGRGAFSYSGELKSVSLPNTIKSIKENGFYYCSSLSSITIPQSVESIGSRAFYHCSALTSFEFPSKIVSIEEGTLTECENLATLILPYGITSIGDNAFQSCKKLDSIEIPSSVNTIGSAAFSGCISLSSITIPNSVVSLGKYNTFNNCISLTSVISEIEYPFPISKLFPSEIYAIAQLSVPRGKKTVYQSTDGWSLFQNIVEKGRVSNFVLSIEAFGNGSVKYDKNSVRNVVNTFTLDEGSSVSLSLVPDNGYRIKSVKVNGSDVISKVSNNSYIISSISSNITIEVEFEAIPIPTYSLSITASGNGSAAFNSMEVKNNTKTFTLNEGTSAAIAFTPDAGYRIKSVKVNSTDVTSKVSNNSYTISSISANTTVEVVFEDIPIPTYTLSITASGNGSVSYSGTSAKNNTKTFTVNEGTSAAIAFTPDAGYRIKSWLQDQERQG